METLHLIVHKSMIEEEINSSLTPKDKLSKLENVLERINKLEIEEKNVKHIKSNMENPYDDGIHHVKEICQGYSKVVLYGISTMACLTFTKKELEKAGHEAVYDSQGTID